METLIKMAWELEQTCLQNVETATVNKSDRIKIEISRIVDRAFHEIEKYDQSNNKENDRFVLWHRLVKLKDQREELMKELRKL